MSKLEELILELESYDENTKADVLIELAEQFQEVPNEIASKPYPISNRVPACESDVYIFYKKNNHNRIKYYFAVLNPQGISAKAFAVILDRCLSNQNLEFISKVDDDIVKRIFGYGITMGKGMGLKSMLGVIKAIASNTLASNNTKD